MKNLYNRPYDMVDTVQNDFLFSRLDIINAHTNEHVCNVLFFVAGFGEISKKHVFSI